MKNHFINERIVQNPVPTRKIVEHYIVNKRNIIFQEAEVAMPDLLPW